MTDTAKHTAWHLLRAGVTWLVMTAAQRSYPAAGLWAPEPRDCVSELSGSARANINVLGSSEVPNE